MSLAESVAEEKLPLPKPVRKSKRKLPKWLLQQSQPHYADTRRGAGVIDVTVYEIRLKDRLACGKRSPPNNPPTHTHHRRHIMVLSQNRSALW